MKHITVTPFHVHDETGIAQGIYVKQGKTQKIVVSITLTELKRVIEQHEEVTIEY